jgi:hypothetical protein
MKLQVIEIPACRTPLSDVSKKYIYVNYFFFFLILFGEDCRSLCYQATPFW